MLLLNASGCLDALAAPEVARSLDAFVTKTVTPEPREGNAPPRIAETDAGMLNAIGLANPGRERFLAETLPALRRLGVPLWVSVGGFSAAEYAETCAALDDVTIELESLLPERRRGRRVCCRDRRGLPRSDRPAALREALARDVGDRRGRPRSRGGGSRRPLAREHATRSRARRASFRPRLARVVGGYSGPALKPVALAAVYACRRVTELPIVGMGGVWTGVTFWR